MILKAQTLVKMETSVFNKNQADILFRNWIDAGRKLGVEVLVTPDWKEEQ